jgi:hypothetical protein
LQAAGAEGGRRPRLRRDGSRRPQRADFYLQAGHDLLAHVGGTHERKRSLGDRVIVIVMCDCGDGAMR